MIPARRRRRVIVAVAEEMFPQFIPSRDRTVVTFLGNSDGDNTFAPRGPARAAGCSST